MRRTDKEGKNMLLTVYSTYMNADYNFPTLRPALVVPMGLVQTQIQEIIAAENASGSPISGNAVDKQNKFDTLAHQLFTITSAASAYYSAPTTADPVKKAKVNFSLSQILHTTYVEMQAFTQGIIGVVTPIITLLADFGATSTNLSDTNTELTKFLEVQNAPIDARNEREVQNANIHPFVKEGKRILTEMCDPIVNTLFAAHHDEYAVWYIAREIVYLPHGTTVIEGFVYASDGITPVYNATVSFAPQGISVKSFLDGSYRAIKFPHGVTTPSATDGTLSETVPPIEVKQGHTVKQNFKLR